MKNILYAIKIFLIATIALFANTTNSKAQSVENMYFNVDWQLNATTGTSFADNLSGWGANAEGGYFLTSNVAVGVFISYHSNNKYISRRTLELDNDLSLTSDQQHHIFQLPFGVTGRYTLNRGTNIQPYVAAKLGTQYSQITSQLNIFELKENAWGFYMSPEVGVSTYLDSQQQIGVHLALYYSYATNKSHILNYKINGLNNLGIRVGLAF